MSRSSYSDDCENLALYRANVDRSIKGRRGQARLRELRDALLALPVKRLEAGMFAGGTPVAPEVCGLGAWALAKCGGDLAAAHAIVGADDADDHDTARALEQYGWPRMVVWEAIYINDEAHYYVQTPEQRYDYVLKWVNEQLSEAR